MSADIQKALARLREPFPAHQISKLCRPTKRENQKGRCNVCGGYHGLPAISFDYVGHAALTDRLLEVDPAWNWEPLSYDEHGLPRLDRDGGMWIKLTICGITRIGYGDAEAKTGPNATKERIGDALRNAAMRFGAALDLWHKGELHLDDGESAPAPQASPAKDSPLLVRLQKAAAGGVDNLQAEFKTIPGGSEKSAVWAAHGGELKAAAEAADAARQAA